VKPYSVCFLGNSHTGAFKTAWTNRAPAVAPGFELRFFAAANFNLENLLCENGKLIPGFGDVAEKFRITSGGLDTIDIAAYDAIVLIGAEFGIHTQEWCDTIGTVRHLQSGPVRQLVSKECFTALIETALEESLAMSLVDKIRSMSDLPILICPKPFLSESTLDRKEIRRNPKLADHALLGEVAAEAKAVAEAVAGQRQVEILWQDPSTIGIPGFTRAELGIDAAHLHKRKEGAPEQKPDGRHMNEEFGFVSLMDVLRRLDEISGGRVLDAQQRSSNVVRMRA
jgi:hypothetical protein